MSREREREKERDVGILCGKIHSDVALEAWTQRGGCVYERGREKEGRSKKKEGGWVEMSRNPKFCNLISNMGNINANTKQ